jgi:hypothetical protein
MTACGHSRCLCVGPEDCGEMRQLARAVLPPRPQFYALRLAQCGSPAMSLPKSRQMSLPRSPHRGSFLLPYWPHAGRSIAAPVAIRRKVIWISARPDLRSFGFRLWFDCGCGCDLRRRCNCRRCRCRRRDRRYCHFGWPGLGTAAHQQSREHQNQHQAEYYFRETTAHRIRFYSTLNGEWRNADHGEAATPP